MRSTRVATSPFPIVPNVTRVSSRGWASLVVLTLALPSAALAAGTVERAQAYLSSQQLPSGDYVGTSVVDTVLAIGSTDSDAAKEAGLFNLAQRRPSDNEAALARALALAGSPLADDIAAAALRDAIVKSASGLVPESGGADPLVLAWGARFAATRPGDSVLTAAVVAQLAALQRQHGGFGIADEPSDFAITADVAGSLASLGDAPGVPAVLASAVAWLMTQTASPDLPAADLSLFLLAARALDVTATASLVGRLLAHQGPAGDFDGDVRSTALAIQALRTALPDLRLQPSLVLDRAPAVGSSYAVTLNVSNIGRMPSPATEISATVTDETKAVVFTGTFPVPGLPPGGATSVVVSLGIQSTQGPRVLTAIVNRDVLFSEGCLDNNTFIMSYRVAGLPDLVIAPGDIAYLPSPPMVEQALDVTVRVRNAGDAVARNVHVQLFQGSPTAGGVLVAEAFLNTVAPGIPRTLSGQVIPKTTDAITLVARVDPENAIAESDETNNSATLVTLKPVLPADFIVDLRGLLGPPSGTTINQGDSFTVSWGIDAFVQRYGGLYFFPEYWPFAGATAVLYRGDAAGQVEIARKYLPASQLAFGPIPSVQFSTTGWVDGTYRFTVVADPLGEVPDVDRSNNTKTIAINVQTGNVAELWMDAVAADPRSVAPGGQVTVRGTVRNTGKAVATNIPVQVQVPGATSTLTVPELAPGASFELTQAVTAPQTPGPYDFSFSVDPQWTIPESSKRNNYASGQFRVLGADLEIVSISTSPDPIPVGQPANAILVVKNVGLTTYPYLIAYVGVPSATGTLESIGSLYTTEYPVSGATATYTIPLTTKALVGDMNATVVLPYAGASQTFPIHALNPDFGVTSSAIRFVPGTPSPGDVVTPQVVVNNRGNLTAPTSVHVYRGYRESNDLASSGSVTVPAGGSAVFVGPPFAVQTSPPYVVTVALDEENAFAEPNENDNSAVRNIFKTDGAVVIAFDQTHDQMPSIGGSTLYSIGGYPDWAHDLTARGYTVKSINPGPEGFTASQLLGVDVVVNVLPLRTYTPAEIAVWQEFFKQGGGLFFIGDWGLATGTPPFWEAPEEDFLQRVLGVDSAHASLGGSVFPTFLRGITGYGQIVDHPITTGVDSVTLNLVGGFSRLPAGAQTLLATGGYTPPNMVVATAFAKERGRVVLLGDTQILDSGVYCAPGVNACVVPYSYQGNRRFGMQAIDWLVNGGPHDYLPDLAFVPSQIQLEPGDPIAGATTATFTVRNVGGTLAPSSGAVVRLYDGDRTAGVLLGESSLEDLAVEGEQTFSFPWDTTRAAGDHVLTAVIDPENKVAELDEANNTITFAVTVRPSNDLRLDPSDLVPSRDGTHSLAITVHNVGYGAVAAGTRLLVTDSTVAGERTIATKSLGSIPARGALTVTVPWPDVDPEQPHLVTVTADADAALVDPTRADDTIRVTLRPPALEVMSPLAETLWGGLKDITWSGSSDEKIDLIYFVAIAAEGGPYTGIGTTSASSISLDTRGYDDGNYRIRVTASDGFLTTTREVPFVISNAAQAVRVFGSGTDTVKLGTGATTTSISVPAATRVSSATLTVTPVGATSVISPTPVNVAPSGLFDVGDAIWFFSNEWTYSVSFGYRKSFNGGVTWSDRTIVPTAGWSGFVGNVVQNRFGFHLVYGGGSGWSPQQYINSLDGTTWSAPMAVQQGDLYGNEEALLLVRQAGLATVSQGSPDGSSWTPAYPIAGVVNQAGVRAVAASGSLHIVAWDSGSLRYYRAAAGVDTSDPRAVSAPVSLEAGLVYDATLFASGGTLFLAYSTNSFTTGWGVWAQRCELARDCTRRDSWLPSPVFLGVGSAVRIGQLRPDLISFVWLYGHNYWRVNGLDRGTRFSPPAPIDLDQLPGGAQWAFRDGLIGLAGAGQGYTVIYDRSPRLTPTDLALDVGAKGTPDVARPGMPGTSMQVPGFAASLNAYLAAHQGDAVGGVISVPVSVTSTGVGQTMLRNLEVRYQALNEIAGFADPPLFSPGSSPGVLDTSFLSLLSSGAVAIMTPAGGTARTLATTASNGRYVTTFDGRDGSGALLSSGPYFFGAPGWPAGSLEIDNIPPTAILDVVTDDVFGNVTAVRGTATDQDFAGSAKNFWRYALEFTTDGSKYAPISSSTAPVQAGVLGTWNTTTLTAGAATLRLTVSDRAGNSSSTSRAVRISPDAPHAPVIQAPTTAGNPVDLLASTTTISGTGDPGTTVTVFLNGSPVGTAPCNGTWTLAGVPLPAGVSTVDAVSARGAITGSRSASITIARYALVVTVDAPAHLPAGSATTATIGVSRTSVRVAPLTVKLSALDARGHLAPFGFTPQTTTLTFPAAGTASFTANVSTLGAIPGNYRVVAEVVAGALAPAKGEAILTLDPSVAVTAVVGTDRAVYDALQTVVATLGLVSAGNIETGPLTASFAFTRPDGSVDTLPPAAIPSIAPGAVASASVLYGAPPLAVGVYGLEVLVLDSLGGVLAAATTEFEVQPAKGAGALAGSLAVTPTPYVRGQILSASFSLTNNAASGDVAVSILLLEQATSAIIARIDRTLSIPSGTTASGTAPLPTAGASGDLLALLVGNGRGLAGQPVLALPWADTTPPVIAITGFTDGEYRSGSVIPIVTITDASPFTSSVTLNGRPFVSGTTVTADGTYELVASATDAYENVAGPVHRSFTIDTVKPIIRVLGVSAGDLVSGAVTPSVTFEDLHLGATHVKLNGADFAPGTPITLDGDYVLVADAEDLAHNTAHLEVPFGIDSTPPQITIAGVTPGELTNATVFLTVNVTDAHPGTTTILLDGVVWDGLPVVGEGDHLLEVHAADLAGNTANASAPFTVDKTPPVIDVAGVTDLMLANHAVLPVITVTDPHGPTSLVFLDGVPWNGLPISAEGDHVLHVVASDAAGNAAERTIHFTIDQTLPAISIAGVTAALITRFPVTPVITVTDLHPGTQTATLDGSPFVSGSTVNKEGDHLLRVDASDAAGNSSSAQVSFTQDFTPPQVVVTGVADGSTYSDPVAPVFSATDAHLATASAMLDGVPFQSGTAVSAAGDHALVVTATDRAGNVATRTVHFSLLVVEASLSAQLDDSAKVLVGLDCDSTNARCADEIAAFLLSSLEAAGIPYEIALDRSAFLARLRTHRHNVRILYRGASAESGPGSPTHLFDELGEATWAGDGLIVVNDGAPDNDPKLVPPLGAASQGRMKAVGAMHLVSSDLGPAQVVSVSGSGVAQRLEGASSVGTSANGSVVLSIHPYGKGRALTLTFNPEANARPEIADLLVRSVRYVAGGSRPLLVPGAPEAVSLTATLTQPALLSFQLVAAPSPGLVVVEAPLADTLSPPTWHFVLQGGESATRWLSVAAPTAGTFSIDSRLSFQSGGTFVEKARVSVPVVVSRTGAQLLADATSAVASLSGTGSAASLKSRALADLAAVDMNGSTASAIEQSITSVLDAIDALVRIGMSADAARERCDDLLRALEVRSAQLSSP